MDSINNILSRREVDEPSEIARIKKYVKDKYDYDCIVSTKGNSLVIGVANSSLLTSLRYHLPELKKSLRIEQELVVRRVV
ncbi:MAG TPA: hypothetical protein VIH90_01920 [Candidatus Saccharimonadales bacterium]